jgi:hypothetical protein
MTVSVASRVGRWRQLVDCRPGEGRALFWSFSGFFLLLAGCYVLRPVREEMGVVIGPENLQWGFTLVLGGMLMLVPLYGWAAARLSRRRLLLAVFGCTTLVLAAFHAWIEQARLVKAAALTAEARTQFFALLDLAVNLLALALQALVAGRLMQRLGLGITLAAVPLLLALPLAALAPVSSPRPARCCIWKTIWRPHGAACLTRSSGRGWPRICATPEDLAPTGARKAALARRPRVDRSAAIQSAVAQSRLRSTARRQPASSAARWSADMAGSKRLSACHNAASSASSCQKPTASPAR